MIYFCFSDECGCYDQEMGKKSQRTHPFYLRTSIILKAEDWISLKKQLNDLKLSEKYNLPIDKELKWSYVWSLRSHQKNLEIVPENRKYKYLENYNYKLLIDFLWDAVRLLEKLDYCKIICSITEYKKVPKVNKVDMLKFHLQEHIQRFQMEIQDSENNLGLLFIDPINAELDEELRHHYLHLLENGDLISEYKNLKDNIICENSEKSAGIQLADYISGIINGTLREDGRGFYCHAVKMFKKIVEPRLRRNKNGEIMGWGIREVPKDLKQRENLGKHFKETIIEFCPQ